MIDVTSALASVVGLIGQYVSERRAGSQHGIEDFQKWLAEHHHDEIIKLIKQSDRTVVAIRALLSEDREQLHRRLEDIDRSLARLACANEGFAPLAAALVPQAALPEQAIDFLRKFVDSGVGRLLETQPGIGESRLQFIPLDLPATERGTIEYDDARFYEDDLATLVALGLIRLDYDRAGRMLFLARA